MTIDLSIFDKKYLCNLKKNIINDENIKKEFLEAFLKDDDPEIVLEVIKSKACTKEILIKALSTNKEIIYREAQKRLLSGQFLVTKEDANIIKIKEEELKKQLLALQEEERERFKHENPLLVDAIEEKETFLSQEDQEGDNNSSLFERLKSFFKF